MLAAFALAAAPAAYRAAGTEPFWTLAIERGRVRLEQVGRPTIILPLPRVERTRGGRRYVGRRIAIEVVARPCSDGMSDRRFPDEVVVRTRDRVLHGCGGVTTGA